MTTTTFLKRASVKALTQWSVALKSGKYRQMTGALRLSEDPHSNAFKYCCLGVACDVLKPGDWETNQFKNYLPGQLARRLTGNTGDVVGHIIMSLAREDMTPLPGSELERMSILDQDSGMLNLAILNDSGRAGFDSIAQLVDHAINRITTYRKENK